MTTLQRGFVVASCMAAICTAVYEARRASVVQLENDGLEQAQSALAEQIQQLQRAGADSSNQVAGLLTELARVRRESAESSKLRGALRRALYELGELRGRTNDQDSPSGEVESVWSQRVDSIKQWFQQNPDKAIPELRLLSEDDWLFTASRNLEVATNDVPEANHNTFAMIASVLRERAKSKFARSLGHALSDFLANHAGVLPNAMEDLLPYFSQGDTALQDGGAQTDNSILQRYQLLKNGPIGSVAAEEPIIVEEAPVDKEVDTLLRIRPGTFSFEGVGSFNVTGGDAGSWSCGDIQVMIPLMKEGFRFPAQ